MDFSDEAARRLLENVPKNVCGFCRHEILEGDEHPLRIEVVGRSLLSHWGCVENASDMQGAVLRGEDVRNEFIRASLRLCHLCRVTGATMKCANVPNCETLFHWTCRIREPEFDARAPLCTRCTARSRRA